MEQGQHTFFKNGFGTYTITGTRHGPLCLGSEEAAGFVCDELNTLLAQRNKAVELLREATKALCLIPDPSEIARFKKDVASFLATLK